MLYGTLLHIAQRIPVQLYSFIFCPLPGLDCSEGIEELGGWGRGMALRAKEIDAHVGQQMRQRREALGVSQGRLASHLGLTFSQVQKYEKGANRIGAGRLYLLAEFLDVPVQYFFDGVGDELASTGDRTGSDVKDAEVAALNDAFLSITDRDTRQSVLALVRSLSGTAAPMGRPRTIAAG